MDLADRAEILEHEERGRGVAAVRQKLAAAGADDCCDCGDPIEAARRAALPSAQRCLTCQQAHERRARG